MRMGWSSNEDLVCILEEGTMATYNIHGLLHYSRPICRVRNFLYVHACICVHVHVHVCIYTVTLRFEGVVGLEWMKGIRKIIKISTTKCPEREWHKKSWFNSHNIIVLQ